MGEFTVLQFYSLLRTIFFQPHLLCLYLTAITENMLIENQAKMGGDYVNYTIFLYISFFITCTYYALI